MKVQQFLFKKCLRIDVKLKIIFKGKYFGDRYLRNRFSELIKWKRCYENESAPINLLRFYQATRFACSSWFFCFTMSRMRAGNSGSVKYSIEHIKRKQPYCLKTDLVLHCLFVLYHICEGAENYTSLITLSTQEASGRLVYPKFERKFRWYFRINERLKIFIFSHSRSWSRPLEIPKIG